VRKFIVRCRERGIAPHVARTAGRRSPGLDARTTRHAGYAISQRKRKRVEEIFGWPKTYGGLRKTRFVGTARVALHATLAPQPTQPAAHGEAGANANMKQQDRDPQWTQT